MRYFKVLCPDNLVSAILGHGGGGRRELEQETSTSLKISRRDEFFPGTRCRIIIASADERDNILQFLERITQMSVEVAGREEATGKGRHREDTEVLTGRDAGEFVVRVALPHSITGALIGPKGERIKSIRETTGAKVFVDNDAFDNHQLVRIIGTPHAISLATPQIMDVLDAEVSEDVLRTWARVDSFEGAPAAAGKGAGGGKKGASKGKGKEERGRSRSRGRGRSRSRGRSRRDGGDEDVRLLCGGDMVEAIRQTNAEFPERRQELMHAVSFELPSKQVFQIMGSRQEYQTYCAKATGTFIEVSKAVTEGSESISIQGPLPAVYQAHFMLMKRYHEHDLAEAAAAEALRVKEEQQRRDREREREHERERERERERRSRRSRSRSRGRSGRSRGDEAGTAEPAHIESLQNQLAELQEQLKAVQRGAAGAGGGAGGGGKGGKGGAKVGGGLVPKRR